MRAAAAEAVKQPKHMLEWTHAYDESMRVLCSGRERGRDRERRGEGYRKRREMMDNEERWMESLVWVEESIPPTTENWLRKRYKYSMKNDKSTEDKHETNHINNKCNDMNMNTRKMHNT